MAKVTPKKLAGVLWTITTDVTEKQAAENVRCFAEELRRWGKTKMVGAIKRAYRRLAVEQTGQVTVRTFAAQSLPASIKSSLQEKYGADVVIDHTIDPLLIGGLKIQVGDVVTDGTVATKLHSLYE